MIISQMDLVCHKLLHIQGSSQPLSPINSSPPLHSNSHTSSSVIAIAIIGILATCFLLVSYYICVIRCCLNWQRIDFLTRFLFSTRQGTDHDPPIVHSPDVVIENRGLDEAAIRSLPILEFKKKKDEALRRKRDDQECAVCLNEFEEDEKIRLIPFCGHFFHVDCIDVWLQNNASCPVCRTSVTFNFDQVLDPIRLSSSTHDPNNFTGRDEDYVVNEIESKQGNSHNPSSSSLIRVQENINTGEFLSISPSPTKLEAPEILRKKRETRLSCISSRGDECIDINRQRDEQFVVEQPMRRSFSMDSATGKKLYSAVQEILQQENRLMMVISEECSNIRVKRSFFSFGSRSSVLPISLDP